MNFLRIDPSMLVAGIYVVDFAASSPARKKCHKKMRELAIKRRDLESSASAYLARGVAATEELSVEKQKVIREYVEKDRFRPDFLEPLRQEILRGLSFVHDYRQINAQIRQNINVILETRYPDIELGQQLQTALPAEKAIYEAAKFLEEKLQVAKFLIEPKWLSRTDECAWFRVHGMVLKYVRIFQSQYDRVGVALSLTGESHGKIFADPQACGVLPQTLLDNALKYSAKGSRVEVFLKDEDKGVFLEVISYGPKLHSGEETKIFDPFYRGKEAMQRAEEGAGYGLYVAQLIAVEHLGTTIGVRQEASAGEFGYRTNFSVVFPWKAKIVF